MNDSDKIIVENIKATVNKIKEWTIWRLPIRYANNSLITYNLRSLANKVIEIATSGSSITTSVNCGNLDIKASNIQVSSNSVDVSVGSVGCLTEGLNTAVLYGKNKTTLADESGNKMVLDSTSDGNINISTDGKVLYSADNTELKFEDGGLVLKDNTGNKHNAIVTGRSESEITDWYQPYAIYNGHTTPIGKMYGTHGEGVMNSRTTYGGYGDDTNIYYINNLTYGTWVLSYSVGFMTASGSRTTGLPDGKKLSAAWFEVDGTTYTICPESRNTVHSGADGSIVFAQGTAIVNVPYGGSKTLWLRAWQNSGANKDIRRDVTVTRIS